MAVTNADGVPLVTLNERRDEWLRCLEVIGWNFGKWADRTGLKLHQAMATKAGKRPIADSDMRWVQMLAAAVASMPRPAVQDDPMPVGHPVAALEPRSRVEEVTVDTIRANNQTAGVDAFMSAGNVVMPQELPASPDPTVRSVELQVPINPPEVVLRALADVYQDGGASQGATPEQITAVRWAMSEIAGKLGLTEALKIVVSPPPAMPEQVPETAVREQQPWSPPQPVYETAGERQAFADEEQPF